MSSLIRKVQAAGKLGWGWAAWRAGYELRKSTGLLRRRLPTPAWDDIRLQDILLPEIPADPDSYRKFRGNASARFFFPPGKPPTGPALDGIVPQPLREQTIAVADDFAAGRFLYYSRHVHDLGLPPDWLLNPFSGRRFDNAAHWCDLSTFSAELGDIKDIWEPSRFACAYWLVRAHVFSGDQKYAEAFWRLFEAWCEQNPPNRGPNWKCGQETAFRVMAWCFALYAFWDCSSSTAPRVAAMVRALAFSASRIEPNIDYAVSQKNNHAISEALGLFTVGTLFPELKDAWKWEGDGRHILEREIIRQVYEDGSYVQQSMNYHRVMLHDCMWAARLADLNGRPLADHVLQRIYKAAEFLFEMHDPHSGGVPNYGPNDGALVLPLSSCDYRDFRPAVQAANYLRLHKRLLPRGPWDETLLWLFGEAAADSQNSSTMPKSASFEIGGYYTLRREQTCAMIRCHSYLDRPGHVDMLHLDLWHRGINVLRDSGTYRYFVPHEPGMEKFFKDIAAHSTIEIGGKGPLELVSRFIWLPWPHAECTSHDSERFVGESRAYDRRPWHALHRRSVEASADGHSWTITDDLLGSGRRQITLRWQLAPGEIRLDATAGSVHIQSGDVSATLVLELPGEMQMEIVEGVAAKSRVGGWMSEYYAEKRPAPVLEATGFVSLPLKLRTTLQLSIQNQESRI